ncbi:MAG: TonB-dependent receptor [Cyclobacteriaceae bacterium]
MSKVLLTAYRWPHIGYLILFFTLITLKVQSQNVALRWTADQKEIVRKPQEQQQLSLKQMLGDIEKKHNIRIVYSSNLVINKTIPVQVAQRIMKTSRNQIEGTIQQVVRPFGMQFRQYNEDYFILKEESPLPKIERDYSKPQSQPANWLNRSTRSHQIVYLVIEKTISGRVTDLSTDEPLPGVNILVKGTSSGTVTDLDGNYRLTVGDEVNTLVFSSIGYETVEESINGRAVINVTLSPDIQSLSEVVVVGYGTVEKSDVTGSVVSLRQEDLNKGLNTSVDQQLQGRAPGVKITGSAEPGGGVSIRIRGSSSINAGNEPLYVIDGLPIDNQAAVTTLGGDAFNGNPPPRNPLNALNPADIASIDILKDASATAIYGSRGANGVILITTKSGAKGKLKVDYNATLSSSEVARKVDVLSTSEYIRVMNELEVARGNGSVFSEADIQSFGGGTDWQDEVFRTAVSQTHNLTLSGGTENTKYYTSLNYTDQEGVVTNSQFKRYQARINLEHQASERFKFGINLNTSVLFNDYVPVNGFGINQNADVINSALNTPPIFPVFNEDGSYFKPEAGQLVSVTLENPVARAVGESGKEQTNRTFGNITAEYQLVPGLLAKLNFGSDRSTSRRDIYNSTITNVGQAANGIATIGTGELNNYLTEFTLNYTKQLNDQNNINALAGYTYQQFDERTAFASIRGFASDIITTNNLGAGDPNLAIVNSNTTQRRLISYLGRINYSFADKYLFTGSVRADGSSNFGENNRFGIFPSFALAWKLINEPFLNQTEFFSDLKLRAGWGQIGNDNIGIGRALSTYVSSTGGVNGAVFGNNLYTPVSAARIPNPDLKWENTEQLNAGVDFGLFDGRLYSSLDFFVKNTKDLLQELPIPSATGFSFVTANVGQIRNSGVEFIVNSKNLVGDFKWSTAFNFATLRNEVISLGELPEIIRGNAGATAIARPGEPLFSYYGYQSEGIFQTQEEIDNSAQSATAAPGVPRWRDVDTNNRIDGDDRVIIGNPFPDLTLGLNNDFAYKNFSLNIFIEGVQGVDLLYWGLVDAHIANDPFRNRLAEPLLNRWTPGNPTNAWPSAVNTAQYQGGNVNTFTIADASFVRLKNVQLSYEFPINSSTFLRTASVYVTGQNLALITDYPGYDPDVNSTGTANIRLDRNAYPTARTYTLGVNIGF